MKTKMHQDLLGFALAAVLAAACGVTALTVLAATGFAQESTPLQEIKSGHSEAFGSQIVELRLAGAKAFVVKPIRPRADGFKPWIWYAPSLSAANGGWRLPTERHARVVKGLLEKGFYFCGVDVGESYGSPAGRETFTRFYRLVVDQFGLAPRACLFPVSRGGLMHYNWAAEHPECVQCIAAIYPVCNLLSYPGVARAARAYGFSLQQLQANIHQHNPLDRLAPLAAAGVPILHLHGDRDTAVPLEQNSAELARRYRALGGQMELLVIEGKGHEIVPEFWQNPRLAEFFLKHAVP